MACESRAQARDVGSDDWSSRYDFSDPAALLAFNLCSRFGRGFAQVVEFEVRRSSGLGLYRALETSPERALASLLAVFKTEDAVRAVLKSATGTGPRVDTPSGCRLAAAVARAEELLQARRTVPTMNDVDIDVETLAAEPREPLRTRPR